VSAASPPETIRRILHLLTAKHFQNNQIRKGFSGEGLGGNVSSQLLAPSLAIAGGGG
jgi:hypothetical protein